MFAKITSVKRSIHLFHINLNAPCLPLDVEACVAELLTPRTLDLEVRGSSLARRVVSLDKELYSTLSLQPGVKSLVGSLYYTLTCNLKDELPSIT